MAHISAQQAQDSLAAAQQARQRVANAVGLPRLYWWGMAAGWIILGAIGETRSAWAIAVSTAAFGAIHAYLASRLLRGRNRTRGVQLSESVVDRRIPAVVVGVLVVLVAVTVGIAFLLDADGAAHPGLLASVFIATVVGLGGPEILSAALRLVRA